MFRFYENSAVKADALLNALGIKEQVGELPEVSPRDRLFETSADAKRLAAKIEGAPRRQY
jgi:hypothetical protein